MKKLRLLLSLSLLNISFIHCREFRTPLPLQKGPLLRVWPEDFKYPEMDSFLQETVDSYWLNTIWAAPYFRKATDAYCDDATFFPCKQCTLADVYFGANTFTVGQTNGTDNPAILSPNFFYVDRGVFFGLQIEHAMNETWRYGLRAAIPYRSFEMKQCENNGCISGLDDKETGEAVLAKQGISFEPQKVRGAGDLDTEFFLCAVASDYFYFEPRLGMRFPIAKKVLNPEKVFLQSLGNNGHLELLAGFEMGVRPVDWFTIVFDGAYSYVTPSTEQVAAPAMGATIKNIGCALPARVSWSYYVTTLDFIIGGPDEYPFSVDIGYGLYYKNKDSISFDTKCMASMDLNPALLEMNTKVLAQKVRFEACYTNIGSDGSFDLFGGFSRVLSGKNTPVDHDWHVGLRLRF